MEVELVKSVLVDNSIIVKWRKPSLWIIPSKHKMLELLHMKELKVQWNTSVRASLVVLGTS